VFSLAGTVCVIAILHLLVPLWALIAAIFVVVVAGSVWATRPPDITLSRHVLALAGQVVLDVLRTILRAVVGLIVVLALLAAVWSFTAPRIEAQVGQWRDSAVGSAKATVTSSWPHLPEIHLPWGDNG
jgi:small-conductance mechanosensitive channel